MSVQNDKGGRTVLERFRECSNRAFRKGIDPRECLFLIGTLIQNDRVVIV